MARPIAHPEDEDLLRCVARLKVWEKNEAGKPLELEQALRLCVRWHGIGLTWELDDHGCGPEAWSEVEQGYAIERLRPKYKKHQQELEAAAHAEGGSHWLNADGSLREPIRSIPVSQVAELQRLVDKLAQRIRSSDRSRAARLGATACTLSATIRKILEEPA